MRQFWEILLEPILDAVAPRRLLEIGVDQGYTTRRLIDWAVAHGAFLDAIDPLPKFDTGEWQRERPDHVRFHLGLSLDLLPELEPPDIAFVDGDHNYYTVHGELTLLEERADATGSVPPLIVLHDMQWPYARRDLYYDATTIPREHRHPHERAGLLPDHSELLERGGFNAHLDHAIFEGGERNGVLTAVEDFVAGSPRRWRLVVISGLNGLGILAPAERLEADKKLGEALSAFGRAPTLRAITMLVESERIASEIRRQGAAAALTESQETAERVPQIEGELRGVRQEVAGLRTALAASREETAQLQGEHDPDRRGVFERELAHARAAYEEAEQERVAATELLKESRRAQDEAEAARATATASLGERDDRLAALTAELTALEAARQDAATRLDAMSPTHQQAALQAQLANAEREDALRRMREADAERHADHERRVEAERELLAATRQLAAAEGRASTQEHELLVLREETQTARALAASAGSQARAAREEADEHERSHERAERRRQAAERRLEELEEESTQRRRQERELAERAEDLERASASLQRRLEEAERDVVRAQAEAEESAQRAIATEQRRSEQARHRDDEQSELARSHEAAMAEAREELAGLRDAAHAREQAAHASEAALERRLAEQAEELALLSAARLRADADLADRRESAERALEDARTEAAQLRHELEAERDRVEDSTAGDDAHAAQVDELRRALTRALSDAESARAHAAVAEARAQAPAAAVNSAPAALTTASAAAAKPAEPGPDRLTVDFNEHELAAHAYFRAEYDGSGRAPGVDPVVDALALPAVRDSRHHVLAEHPEAPSVPTVDIVVCVHNALADVRRCLWSVLHKTDRPYRLVVVNDGSDEDTTQFLEEVVAAVPAVRLVRNPDPPHGYTVAANLGLRAARGDYVILLNSDTIVTLGWLDRIVDCGESDPRIGILGPLSNAASHQSVPALRDAAGWSTNPLPSFVTPDAVAELLGRVSSQDRPRIPFVNGFCYVIKRTVIDAIGYLDEENFASGYCEENDYSVRAAEAGFELAVVDDGYVFHAKSKSFGVETRKVHAKRNYEIFLEKHGRERIKAAVSGLEENTALAPLRSRVSDALSSPLDLAAALDSVRNKALRVMFILPGLGEGGSGGSHSIYQEVHGMRALGLDAQIALRAKSFDRARGAYEDADEIFVPYRDEAELAAVTAHADVVIATHFKSAVQLAGLCKQRSDFLPAYYVQDYEPFFTARDSADADEAIASYTLVPGCLLFAKTHWLCNIVSERHGVHVAKVEPSIDEAIYRPSEARRSGGPLRVAAMVRPRTPRRQPSATVAVLEQLSLQRGTGVEVITFGCSRADLEQLTDHPPLLSGHRGLLRRTEVSELLGASDVFLDLSMYQAFGRTALEAMACATTAVVPRLGGVWEFLDHGVNGLAIDAFAPEQALEALSGLADDRGRLERMQAAARQTGMGYSVLRAALSEYLVLAREHQVRFGPQTEATTNR